MSKQRNDDGYDRLIPRAYALPLIAMLLLAGAVAWNGDLGGAGAISAGVLLCVAAMWSGRQSADRTMEALRAYHENGTPLPPRLERKRQRWLRERGEGPET